MWRTVPYSKYHVVTTLWRSGAPSVKAFEMLVLGLRGRWESEVVRRDEPPIEQAEQNQRMACWPESTLADVWRKRFGRCSSSWETERKMVAGEVTIDAWNPRQNQASELRPLAALTAAATEHKLTLTLS
ncbi:unnamed protein product [Cercospora beticola]|nr:unnamed protein product [Cercospora beticola]